MDDWREAQIHEETMRKLALEMDLLLIDKLKPEFGKDDGNQFYFFLGENLREGIVGFGDTVAEAVSEFSKAYYSKIK